MPLASLIAAACLAGGLAVIAWGMIAYRAIWQSRTWPSVTGAIESARIVEQPAGDAGSVYVVRIAFRYVVAGNAYRSERRQFGGDTRHGTRKEAQQELERSFTPGTEVRVFFSPKQPARAVLNREVTFNLVGTLIAGGLFAAAGAFLLLMPR